MIVNIEVDNIWGRILERLPSEVLSYLQERTRYHPPGYDRTWNYKKGRWDGYNHCFDILHQVFRAGLVDRICHGLKARGIEARVVYRGTADIHPVTASIGDGIIRPYDFQQRVRAVVRENARGIIESPTGSGKTVMTAIAVDELQRRTLVILNDLVLLDQMHRALTRFFPGIQIGYVGNSEFELGDITVATIQSLRSILGINETKKKAKDSENRPALTDWLNKCDIVIHDEVHLADADTCLMFYGTVPNVSKIFGFSATPYSWANKKQGVANIELEQVFGKVIYSTFDLDFVALGLKVPLIVKQVELQPRIKVYGTFRDNQAELYKKALEFEIIQNVEWHQTVKQLVDEFTRDGQTCFIYAAHKLEYGEKLATLLGAPFVQGKTRRAERFRIFDALESKQIPCIVSDIGGVGLDIPSLNAFILASDAKDVRQFKGRVERASPKSGKQTGVFVDLWKNCSFLNKHHELRENQYKDAGNIII